MWIWYTEYIRLSEGVIDIYYVFLNAYTCRVKYVWIKLFFKNVYSIIKSLLFHEKEYWLCKGSQNRVLEDITLWCYVAYWLSLHFKKAFCYKDKFMSTGFIKYRLVTFHAYHYDGKKVNNQLFLSEDFKEAFAFQWRFLWHLFNINFDECKINISNLNFEESYGYTALYGSQKNA